MLDYVPVNFSLYRPLKPHLRWTLQCLVAFADRTGKCWPSVRKLAEVSDLGKSTVSRHLAELTRIGIISRTRKPGGVYSYTIDARFLPAARAVSHAAPKVAPKAVPAARIEEKVGFKNTDSHDDSAQWDARMRAWHRSGGRFWPAFAGPRPDEPGCWAPVKIQTISA